LSSNPSNTQKNILFGTQAYAYCGEGQQASAYHVLGPDGPALQTEARRSASASLASSCPPSLWTHYWFPSASGLSLGLLGQES
jgi:hypothetical protein